MDDETKQIFIDNVCPICNEPFDEKNIKFHYEDKNVKIRTECKHCGMEYFHVVMNELLSTEEVAERYNVKAVTVRNDWANEKTGFLQFIKVANRKHIETTELKWVEEENKIPKRKRRRKK
mgnify:FL=1|jgi:formylmethanofuran dehydrogenase subunit B|tara:strand:+ start:167 stop:526 length:360 start_codon:yes stop_codon:yes gene_type:complete